MQARAAVMPERHGRWTLETLEVAEPGPQEVLVRVVASGICQTDVHARDGFFPIPCPAVYGHEGAGVVEQVGRAVTTLKPGDHVLMANPSCGREYPKCNRRTSGLPERRRFFRWRVSPRPDTDDELIGANATVAVSRPPPRFHESRLTRRPEPPRPVPPRRSNAASLSLLTAVAAIPIRRPARSTAGRPASDRRDASAR